MTWKVLYVYLTRHRTRSELIHWKRIKKINVRVHDEQRRIWTRICICFVIRGKLMKKFNAKMRGKEMRGEEMSHSKTRLLLPDTLALFLGARSLKRIVLEWWSFTWSWSETIVKIYRGELRSGVFVLFCLFLFFFCSGFVLFSRRYV